MGKGGDGYFYRNLFSGKCGEYGGLFFGVNGISGKIRNGDIDLYLTKPVSPLLRLSFEQVNPGSFPLVALSVCILWYGVRLCGLRVSAGHVLGYLVWVTLMIVLWYEMEVIIRSLTFSWFPQST